MSSSGIRKVVLVTGAAGFVAEHLIPKLKRDLDCIVIGLDRKNKPSAICDYYINCDLNDLGVEHFQNIPAVDMVYHLAAARADWGISDDEYFSDNYDASVALLAVCEALNINELVFTSSVSVMPQNNPNPQSEQAPIEPINAYGSSKAKAEKKFEEFAFKDAHRSIKIIRPVVLYGPSDPEKTGLYRAVDNNIFRLIDGIFKKRFAIVGDGATIKSTAYVHNFVAALTFISDAKPGLELFIYADEPTKTTLELVHIIRRKLGRPGSGVVINYHFAVSLAQIFDPLSRFLRINFPITKARIETFVRPTNFKRARLNRMGFEQPISTEQAIEDTVDWYKQLRQHDNLDFFFLRDNSQSSRIDQT